MTSVTTLAAHAMLDMISVQEFVDENMELTEVATQTAFERLSEIGAVHALRDDETDALTLDLSPILTASGALITMLMSQVCEMGGYHRDDVIVAMRHVIDDLSLADSQEFASWQPDPPEAPEARPGPTL